MSALRPAAAPARPAAGGAHPRTAAAPRRPGAAPWARAAQTWAASDGISGERRVTRAGQGIELAPFTAPRAHLTPSCRPIHPSPRHSLLVAHIVSGVAALGGGAVGVGAVVSEDAASQGGGGRRRGSTSQAKIPRASSGRGRVERAAGVAHEAGQASAGTAGGAGRLPLEPHQPLQYCSSPAAQYSQAPQLLTMQPMPAWSPACGARSVGAGARR